MHLKIPTPKCRSCTLLIVGWSVIVVVSVLWNLYLIHENTLERARIEARTIFEHNLAYRKWNTRHGGVYVKVDEATRPNPYLEIHDRDLQTIEGHELTMINPFQMTREAYELLQENMEQPTYNRTVSHDYLNPINSPDEWETRALDSFVGGVEEISEVTVVKSSPYLRLLKPYVAMEGCIKCHDAYTPGDIRGGMSIAVAMGPYYKSEAIARNSIIITHFFLWLIGVFSIGTLTRNIQTQQKKLVDSEEKFRILAEFSNDWEYWLSEDQEVVFMSPSCESITGYTQNEFINNPNLIEKIIYPEDRETFQHGMKSARNADLQQTTEFRIITKREETKWLSQVWQPVIVQGRFVGKRVSSRNITEKKKLEQQLVHAQKMEAVGSLAGGIAHDFNNILTSIIGYGQILSVKLGKDNALKDKAEAILLAGRRASTLTNQLLAFSRKQVLEMRPMNLNELVLNLEDFLTRLIGEHIQLEIKTDPNAGNIMADAVQIEQIIMNLTVNARDAMPNGGRILISTGATEIIQGKDKKTVDMASGGYAILNVSDTGSGIPRDIQDKIYEPFFTTKPSGKGTGLGLATVFGIVTQHKGAIQLNSRPGKGTSFEVLLPKTDDASMVFSAEKKVEAAAQQGTEILLVVDDDHTICNLIADTLQPMGYKVLTATTGNEALELLRSHKSEISLLLTDVIMPAMNGRELSTAANLLQPGIKIIYMSGYTGNIIARHGLLESGVNFINKPLESDKLAYKIRQVLDVTKE